MVRHVERSFQPQISWPMRSDAPSRPNRLPYARFPVLVRIWTQVIFFEPLRLPLPSLSHTRTLTRPSPRLLAPASQMKLLLLVIAMVMASASAAKKCTVKSVKYSPIAPLFSLDQDKVNTVCIDSRPP